VPRRVEDAGPRARAASRPGSVSPVTAWSVAAMMLSRAVRGSSFPMASRATTVLTAA
jgi:hypothetical protein